MKTRYKIISASLTPVNVLVRKKIQLSDVKRNGFSLEFTARGRDEKRIDGMLENYSDVKKTKVGAANAIIGVLSRIGIIVGFSVIAILLFLYSKCTFSIEVRGLMSVSESDVVAVVMNNATIPNINLRFDAGDTERQLTLLPGVSDASVERVGTILVVTVLEETPPLEEPLVLSDTALCSGYDAVITRVIAISGTSVVKEGDTVKKGQSLIEPVSNAEENPIKTKAAGKIFGRVWLSESGFYPDETATEVRTGKSETFTEVKGFEKLMPIVSPYKSYERSEKTYFIVGGILPIEITEITFFETETQTVPFDYDKYRDALTKELTDRLCEKIPQDAKKLKTWQIEKRLDKGTQLVIYYELELDILL